MAGAALLPGHGGFTLGDKDGFLNKEDVEQGKVEQTRIQESPVTSVLRGTRGGFLLCVNQSSHRFVSDKPERRKIGGNNKIIHGIICCPHGNS